MPASWARRRRALGRCARASGDGTPVTPVGPNWAAFAACAQKLLDEAWTPVLNEQLAQALAPFHTRTSFLAL